MQVELENLIKQYGEDCVKDIISNWQNNPSVHPLTCIEHNSSSLKYSYGKLYCTEKNCTYYQHWIPSTVIKQWEAGL
jgi:hypothetical protein